MIPAEVASRAQLAADSALRPAAPAQQITDKLADLVPGQRLLAEIQAILPNGTYRAMVAQRDVTLALPFSAKAGDTLELEVVDHDGKLTLALLNRSPGESARNPGEAASTTLSRTGQLIAGLFGRGRDGRGEATPLPLNGNQPIAAAPPQSAQDILPLLRQAIVQSGMFYESHQAEWVAGRFEKAALLQEPQGKLSAALHTAPQSSEDGTEAPVMQRSTQIAPPPPQAGAAGDAETRTGQAAQLAQPGGQLVAREAMPVVQQQLESLASQQFSWQGLVWPGQQMRWEIEENAHSRREDDETAPGWQTRLYLTLPQLGELEARIRIAGSQIHLDLDTADIATGERLRAALGDLRRQLDDAGLALGNVGIGALAEASAPEPEANGAAGA